MPRRVTAMDTDPSARTLHQARTGRVRLKAKTMVVRGARLCPMERPSRGHSTVHKCSIGVATFLRSYVPDECPAYMLASLVILVLAHPSRTWPEHTATGTSPATHDGTAKPQPDSCAEP
jgi:hypothetical protein